MQPLFIFEKQSTELFNKNNIQNLSKTINIDCGSSNLIQLYISLDITYADVPFEPLNYNSKHYFKTLSTHPLKVDLLKYHINNHYNTHQNINIFINKISKYEEIILCQDLGRNSELLFKSLLNYVKLNKDVTLKKFSTIINAYQNQNVDKFIQSYHARTSINLDEWLNNGQTNSWPLHSIDIEAAVILHAYENGLITLTTNTPVSLFTIPQVVDYYKINHNIDLTLFSDKTTSVERIKMVLNENNIFIK